MPNKLFFSIIFITLLLAFYFDLSTGPDDSMYIKSHNAEPRVYGRLAKSGVDGFFSSGLLQGFCMDNESQFTSIYGDTGPTNSMIQVKYYEFKFCPYYLPYKSHPGAQGTLFYLISRIYAFPGIFRIITGAVLSLVITFWLFWLSTYFDRTAVLLTFLSLFLLKWFILFGDNIGLFVGTMYLPMVSLFWVIKKRHIKYIVVTAFLAMLISCLFSGAEFIFSTIVMAFTPVVFYAVKRKWTVQTTLNTGFKVGLGVFLACLIILGLLVAQINTIDSSLGGIDHFVYSVGKRTYGNPSDYRPSYGDALLQPLGRVIQQYLNMPAINAAGVSINFRQLILFYLIVSFLAKLVIEKSKDRNLLGLLAITWIGLLGPLSWLVICKAHAYQHPFMDPLVWHMPFVLYGMALTGATVNGLIQIISVKTKNKSVNVSRKK